MGSAFADGADYLYRSVRPRRPCLLPCGEDCTSALFGTLCCREQLFSVAACSSAGARCVFVVQTAAFYPLNPPLPQNKRRHDPEHKIRVGLRIAAGRFSPAQRRRRRTVRSSPSLSSVFHSSLLCGSLISFLLHPAPSAASALASLSAHTGCAPQARVGRQFSDLDPR